MIIIYSDEFLQHKTGVRHPERPMRLSAIVEGLKTAFSKDLLDWQLPTPAKKRQPSALEWVKKIHSHDYIKRVEQLAYRGGGYLNEDTPVSPKSYDVALLAASAWLDGIDRVLATFAPAFVLARPPGHHAQSDRGMGFCVFCNAAIAATYALEQPGVQKVAILDWDVHHGNATQAIVENNPNIAYCSLHQFPCYPGTGYPEETGHYNNVLNLPVSAGSTVEVYKQIFEDKVIPFLTNFQPDLLIVSAGYDANEADPLAQVCLQPEDYGVFTDYCLLLTRKILFGLEGGYDLSALSQSVVATVERCLVSVT